MLKGYLINFDFSLFIKNKHVVFCLVENKSRFPPHFEMEKKEMTQNFLILTNTKRDEYIDNGFIIRL